jgi:hypothetical protein
MKVKVTVIEAAQQFTNKAGKIGYRAPCTFDDVGARYPQGRGTCYANAGSFGPGTFEAVLISYDHGEARFAVRENR